MRDVALWLGPLQEKFILVFLYLHLNIIKLKTLSELCCNRNKYDTCDQINVCSSFDYIYIFSVRLITLPWVKRWMCTFSALFSWLFICCYITALSNAKVQWREEKWLLYLLNYYLSGAFLLKEWVYQSKQSLIWLLLFI